MNTECQGWHGDCEGDLVSIHYTYEDVYGVMVACEACRETLESNGGTWYRAEQENTMTTITVTWKAFSDSLTIGEEVASATIVTDIKSTDLAIADALFRDTNTYQGALWNLLEPVLPANRTHTALSVGDEVTINGVTYRCASIGWEEVSSDKENK